MGRENTETLSLRWVDKERGGGAGGAGRVQYIKNPNSTVPRHFFAKLNIQIYGLREGYLSFCVDLLCDAKNT